MERLRMEVIEAGRRFKRLTDGHMTRRRIVILILFLVFFFLYIGPGVLRWLLNYDSRAPSDPQGMCMYDKLTPFQSHFSEYDVNIRRKGILQENNAFVPYIGNGVFGLTLEADAHFNIKSGRTLSRPVNFHPIISVDDFELAESYVVDYSNGIVHRFQCSPYGHNVVYKYYAHRTLSSLLVQEIRISNPSNTPINLSLSPTRVSDWPTISKQTIKLHHGLAVNDYEVITGMIDITHGSDQVHVVSIVSRVLPESVSLKSKDSITFNMYTTIDYSEPVSREKYAEQKDIIERNAIKAMERAIQIAEDKNKGLREIHANIWKELWYTGFSISDSKAQDAINGDKINATIYAVLSQVRSLEHEEAISSQRKMDILRSLTYTEGCYKGYFTLQANNLWKSLDNLYQINAVVGAWLLTLEKQGCHNLLRAGASGAIQAMVLSFGGLRFSNQHLEFNIPPSDLHRDFLFRRINYGNMTHVNISVVVQDDNKAALYVALDRSDRNYYACDGGCLDSPIQLGPVKKYFPVKLTDPLTAVLYITSDKQHMEDLRHAIHVKEVVIAPAHEHHVIALHKHGHSLGGLPTMFWVSICFLIVLFHLFLCRIIMTEYCDPADKYRRLYSKP